MVMQQLLCFVSKILGCRFWIIFFFFFLRGGISTVKAENAAKSNVFFNDITENSLFISSDTITVSSDTVNIGIKTYIIKHRAAITSADTVAVGMQIVKVNYWDVKNITSFTVSQTGYNRWADGGENSMTIAVFDDFYATYIRRNFMFASYAKASLAYFYTQEQKFQKTEDRIDLKTSAGYDIYKENRTWYGATYFTLTSQFANGFNSNGDLVSSFFAPANTTLSLGVIYQHSKYWTFFFAPISGSSIFVLNQELADKGTGGVTPAEYKQEVTPDGEVVNVKVKDGDKTKLGLGFFTEITWRQPIYKNIDIDTKLRLSNNYIDKRKNNRWNFDIDYQLGLNFAITKYFSVNMRMHFVYDDDIQVAYKKKVDGESVIYTGPTLQFKEIMGLGLVWKFSNAPIKIY